MRLGSQKACPHPRLGMLRPEYDFAATGIDPQSAPSLVGRELVVEMVGEKCTV